MGGFGRDTKMATFFFSLAFFPSSFINKYQGVVVFTILCSEVESASLRPAQVWLRSDCKLKYASDALDRFSRHAYFQV